MDIKASGGLQDAVNLNQAQSHADEVGKKGRFLQYRPKSTKQLNRFRAKPTAIISDYFLKSKGRLRVPSPSVGECLRLCGILSLCRAVDLVVVSLRVERRVDIAEVYGFGRDALPKDLEIIPVVESVRRCGIGHEASLAGLVSQLY